MKEPPKRPSSVDDYIRAFPKDVQAKLQEMRLLVRKIVPEAEERISYQMPAYFLNGILVYFGGHSSHIGFYPTSSGISAFEKELSQYKHSKGAIQFPLDEPLPTELIQKIVRFRMKQTAATSANTGPIRSASTTKSTSLNLPLDHKGGRVFETLRGGGV